jgi:hypothetical protein
MKVKIREVTEAELKEALIREGKGKELPSMHNNWKFNFATQLKNLSNAKAYVLVTADASQTPQGCMIFQLVEKVIPYMAYLETAPHNRGIAKKYDDVAGCLIAFACKLALTSKDENHRGYLTFNVGEKDLADEKKLIEIYLKKYGATHIANTTTLYIPPEIGEKLMAKYLID